MAAAQTCTAMAANGIDFIDKDDGRRMALGLFEKITHAAGANTDEHFHEFGAGDGEEGNARFTGNSFCHQGLAGTGSADQEDALGNSCTKGDEFLWFSQEFNNLP